MPLKKQPRKNKAGVYCTVPEFYKVILPTPWEVDFLLGKYPRIPSKHKKVLALLQGIYAVAEPSM
jgi:hypothetical protein